MKRNTTTILIIITFVVAYAIGIATSVMFLKSEKEKGFIQQELDFIKSEIPPIANDLWLLEKELVNKGVIEAGTLDVWRESLFEEPNNVSAVSNFVNRMLEEVQGIP